MNQAPQQPDAEAVTLPAFMQRLPFGSPIEIDFWSPPTRTGVPDIDEALGAHYANVVMDIAKLQGSGALLVDVISAMILKGRCGSLEIGFLKEIAPRAYVGSHN